MDRYGQPRKQVRVITYYGIDNQIDGIVLNVLIKKHRNIRSRLGISVPVPIDSEKVIEAIFKGLLLRENTSKAQTAQAYLPGFEELLYPERDELFNQWEASADREDHSRKTIFAQQSINVKQVADELAAVRSAIGSKVEVEAFAKDVLAAHGAFISPIKTGALQIDVAETPRALRDSIDVSRFITAKTPSFKARFELPIQENELYLSRTHPIIEGLATYVMEAALDSLDDTSEKRVARRCGVISTSRVTRRTTLLLMRLRFHIVTQRASKEYAMLAEDCQLLAFTGTPNRAEWLSDQEAIEQLLDARSEANILPDRAKYFLNAVLSEFDTLRPHLQQVAKERGRDLLTAHRRVREAAQTRGSASGRGIRYRVEEQLPPDVLGVYIYLPFQPSLR
ncbi:MAG: hypothetical protein JO202_10850 [Ktedonobacteraceae bacterium]|nr:hypothetical protein [Ktedonobacteraceae bacterium]